MADKKQWMKKKAAKTDGKTPLHFDERDAKPAKAGKKKSPLHSNPRSAD